MSSSPPNPSLLLPVTSSPEATTTTVAPLLPVPGSSVAPAPAVLTPEVSGALQDLTQAVQEIRLFLAGSYAPHRATVAAAAPGSLRRGPLQQPLQLPSTAPPWLPWQPPHQAASAALAGPLQLPSTASPWLQWQPPLLAASAAPRAPPQQPLQLQQPPPVSSGPASTAPAGVPIHQIKFPPSPSPLPQGVPIQQIKFPPSPRHRFRLGSLPATCRRR
nr:vegetative cell wall protein gp1-like [Aegilops tauschii subsp. strangulata]